MAFPVGWPPRPASGRRSIRFYKAGTGTAKFEDSAYLFTDENSAVAFNGSGTNGTVVSSVTTPGTPGNAYEIEVVLPTSGGPHALAATLTGTLVTVSLATDGADLPIPAANTATLVAAQITALVPITSFATGTGATPLGVAEVRKSFVYGGSLIIPTPYVPAGGANVQANVGDRNFTGSMLGTGANPGDTNPIAPIGQQVTTAPMVWAGTIVISNDGVANNLEVSFDGVNHQGTILPTETRIYRNRYEAGISVRGVTAFRVEAW